MVGAIVRVADAEVAPAILHAVPAVWALRVHVAWGGGNFCKHMASAHLHQPVAGGHTASCLARNGSLLTLQGLMRREGPSVPLSTDHANGNGQSGCPASFGVGAHEGCGSLPVWGSRAVARGWERHGSGSRRSDGDASVVSSAGNKISRLKSSTCPGTVLGSGMGRVSPGLPNSLPARGNKHGDQEAFAYRIHREDQKTQAGTGRW